MKTNHRSWEELQPIPNDYGIEIQRRVNSAYTVFKFSNHKSLILKGKYNHKNKKEVEASFSSPLFSNFGTETVLTPEEAILQHRGVIRSRLKLSKKMSEEDVIEKIFIPAVIDHGLIPYTFPLKTAENPFHRKDVPFIEGYSFHSFTNLLSGLWVAYICLSTGDIWITSNLINWNWKEYKETEKKNDIVPWVLSEEESDWISSLFKIRDKFHGIYKIYSSNKK